MLTLTKRQALFEKMKPSLKTDLLGIAYEFNFSAFEALIANNRSRFYNIIKVIYYERNKKNQ
jgi:hypothetical protein